MIDCDFLEMLDAKCRRVVGWKCNRCGYQYRHPTDRPPRRNCPKSPDALDVLRDAIRQRHNPELHMLPAVIETELACCQACERFRGRCCAAIPGCDAAAKFIAQLLFGRCPAGCWPPTAQRSGKATGPR